MSSPFAARTSVEGEGDVKASRPISLTFTETIKTFDPVAVYGDAPNPTQL